MKNLSRFSKLFLSLAMVVGVLFGAVQGVSAYNERTIICSGGSYFDKYGPGAYWTEHGSRDGVTIQPIGVKMDNVATTLHITALLIVCGRHIQVVL